MSLNIKTLRVIKGFIKKKAESLTLTFQFLYISFFKHSDWVKGSALNVS